MSLIKKQYLNTVRLPVLAIVLCFAAGLQANQLYRYTNTDGVPVINDIIPPEYISSGYDIINPDGSLIQRIPRALTEDELRLRNTDEARERLRQEEAQRQQAWDESLMLRYSSIEDIEAAESRAMRDLNIRISILYSNLGSIKSQIEREQQKAADIERSGGVAPVELTSNIDILRQEIEDTEQSIGVRQEEINAVKESYLRDIERFKTLQARVQMRREQYQAAPSNRPRY